MSLTMVYYLLVRNNEKEVRFLARPQKCRRVCKLPTIRSFGPKNSDASASERVCLAIEEYETIRLIDYQNMTQSECAKRMNVARSTVQAAYNTARKKISKALIEGKDLVISGGHYQLCTEASTCYSEGKRSFVCPFCLFQKQKAAPKNQEEKT